MSIGVLRERLRPRPVLLSGLFFLSGAAGLMYEVLWFKDLAYLFGGTSRAATVSLAVFFMGLALGSYTWGKYVGRMRRPLYLYAFLELLIVVSAVFYMLVYGWLKAMLPEIGDIFALGSVPLVIVQSLLTLILLFPAAFCMGGTLPAAVETADRLGLNGRIPDGTGHTGWIYTAYTGGAAAGAIAAGFLLAPWLGYRGAYITTIALNVVLGGGAIWLARKAPARSGPALQKKAGARKAAKAARAEARAVLPDRILLAIGALSGFASLGLQVAWLQLLTQVVPSDVYAIAAILAIFLACLAGGAGLAQYLRARNITAYDALAGLAVTGGMAAALSPLVFQLTTGGLQRLPGGLAAGTILVGLLTMALPVILIGAIFPYVFSLAGQGTPATGAGREAGRVVAANTLGAILGSLVIGFVLLPQFGAVQAIELMAASYVGLAAILAVRAGALTPGTSAAASLTAIAAIVIVLPLAIGSVVLNPAYREHLQALWHGANGNVAVIRSYPPGYPDPTGDLSLKLNNAYTLGGAGAAADERRQTQLAFWQRPDARSVFYLGLATGITAGAALDYPVGQITACELIPEVVTASRSQFGSYNNGLFEDPRVRVIAEDGRTCLSYDRQKYDLIISDLFNPAHAGTGRLYTREHFVLSRDRLNRGGALVQWLPLYQLTEEDFSTIARTMLEAFPQVTMWRGNYSADKPIVALVGEASGSRLDPARLLRGVELLGGGELTDTAADSLISVQPGQQFRLLTDDQKRFVAAIWPRLKDAVPFTFYMGDLTANARHFQTYPLNTDDHPTIEFGAPKRQDALAGGGKALTGRRLVDWTERTLRRGKAADGQKKTADRYLARLSTDQRRFVQAGQEYYTYFTKTQAAYRDQDQSALTDAQKHFTAYKQQIGIAEEGTAGD